MNKVELCHFEQRLNGSDLSEKPLLTTCYTRIGLYLNHRQRIGIAVYTVACSVAGFCSGRLATHGDFRIKVVWRRLRLRLASTSFVICPGLEFIAARGSASEKIVAKV